MSNGTPIKRWNTPRLAGMGALCGLAYGAYNSATDALDMSFLFGYYVGNAAAGAIIAGAISAIRNFVVKFEHDSS